MLMEAVEELNACESVFLSVVQGLRSGSGVVCSEHFDKVLPVELVYLFFLLYLGFRDLFFLSQKEVS